MEAAPVLYAVDEKVLVGYHQHQAYVARPVRTGDDTVLVRWESTGAREEVAVGDVKKIDLDAKRPRRKRRDASAAQAEAAAPARREPPGKRRKKKADAGALVAHCTAIAQRFVGRLSGGSADDQEETAKALWCFTRCCGRMDTSTAIVEAGGVEALSALLANGSDVGKSYAQQALKELGPLAEYASRLQSENASLKRQLAGDDVVDLCDGDASPPAKKRNALRDAHDEQQSSTLKRVKEEKDAVEGARDRTDAVAAAASAAAAAATAEAADAAEELEDVHDDLVNPLTLTVNALQTKIDELHALAYQVDPVAADAIKNRQN
ncbi:unnamed protein product [Pelagomonas calceolata]|uniref:Uncharacterized protein n=1 Tax=Pelagomonas calceolata TaxID=35677 RepID=A0A8J2WHU1_9STRA|nr:unnamed protein product [Pelagomonas calceolata]